MIAAASGHPTRLAFVSAVPEPSFVLAALSFFGLLTCARQQRS